jgi:hypothetical protein
MNQTMHHMIKSYQRELDSYIGLFIKKWGYFPVASKSSDYKFLPANKQKMGNAFWKHRDVVKCTAIMDCFGMVLADCKIRSEREHK